MEFNKFNNLDELLKTAIEYYEHDIEYFDDAFSFEFINNFRISDDADAMPYYEPKDVSVGIMHDHFSTNASVTTTTNMAKENFVELLLMHKSLENYIKEEGLDMLKEYDLLDEVKKVMLEAVDENYGVDPEYNNEVLEIISSELSHKVKEITQENDVIYITIEFFT